MATLQTVQETGKGLRADSSGDSKKELLFSTTARDLKWDYFRGSGKGGQARNKTSNAVRCTHEPSGAVGRAEEQRSQLQNRKLAFRRMAESKEFQKWVRIEAARKTGQLALIEKKVEDEMKRVKLEIHNEKGQWVQVGLNDPLDKDDEQRLG